MRDLSDVLDKMMVVAPDLKEHLEPIKLAQSFAAPELQGMWWNEAATTLSRVALNHPKALELKAIFAGTA